MEAKPPNIDSTVDKVKNILYMAINSTPSTRSCLYFISLVKKVCTNPVYPADIKFGQDVAMKIQVCY